MDKRLLLLCTLTWLAVGSVQAGWAPGAVQDSLKSLYPHIQTVAWDMDQGYYVAGFQYNGFPTKVWFTSKGRWIMKQTDWQVMDEVPDAVYHTFTFGPYSTDEVMDVTYVEFPVKKAQIVIRIGITNELTEYQLFYLPDGEMINARDVTGKSDILGASTFL